MQAKTPNIMKNLIMKFILTTIFTFLSLSYYGQNCSFDIDISKTDNSFCGSDSCSYVGPSILINEIMMTPSSPYDGSVWGPGPEEGYGEWIELYNPDLCDSVDVSCYMFGNTAFDSDGSSGSISQVYPGGYTIPQGTVVPPGGFVVIRGMSAFEVPEEELLENGGSTIELVVDNEDYFCFGDGFRLWFPNLGGWFAFYDNNGVPQDVVYWGEEQAFPDDVANAYPCVSNVEGCFQGTLPSFNDIPDYLKTKITEFENESSPFNSPPGYPIEHPEQGVNQGKTLRRVPDGGDWQIAEFAMRTIGECNGVCNPPFVSECDGTAFAQASGGTGNFQYEWSTGDMGQEITNLCAGTYYITVTDNSSGDICVDSVIIEQPYPLDSDFSLDTLLCLGETSYVNANNSYPQGVYHWDFATGNFTIDNEGTHEITPTTIGEHTVSLFISENNGCPPDTVEKNIIVIDIDEPVIVLDSAECEGDTIAIYCTTEAESYYWEGPHNFVSDSQNIIIPESEFIHTGTYYLTVTNNFGCSDSSSVDVFFTAGPVVEVSKTDLNCYNDTSGSISATVTDGTAPFEYQWSSHADSATTSDVDSLNAGTYVITITDGQGCRTVRHITVEQPDEINIQFTDISNAICHNTCTGEARANAYGGTPAFSYFWDNGDSTDFSNNLCEGDNYVTVTDINGCVKSKRVFIAAPPPIEATLETINPLCFGDNSGVIDISATGGTPPLNYSIGSGWHSNSTFHYLEADTFSISIKDANDCILDSIEAIITQPPGIIVDTIIKSDILCFGDNDGTVNIIANGGTGALSYSIDNTNFQDTGYFDNLHNGVFSVAIKDSNQCTINRNFFIYSPPPISFVEYHIDSILCHGDLANLSITAQGGAGGITYSLNEEAYQPTGDFNNLIPGNHNIRVKDNNNCLADTNINIIEPDPVVITNESTEDVKCYNESNGSLIVEATGGTGQLTYSLSGTLQNTGYFDELMAGNYIIRVYDENNCTVYSNPLIINHPPPVVTSMTKTDVICHDDCNGNAIVYTEGGNDTIYNYLWSTNDTTPLVNDLCPGTYSVTVSDVKNCTSVNNITINNQPEIELSIPEKYKLCIHDEVIMTPEITNGIAPFSFKLNGEFENPPFVISHNQDGFYNYTVQVIDANGCMSAIEECNINVFPEAGANLIISNDSICPGEPVIIYPEAWGGEPPYWFYDADGNNISMPATVYPQNSQTITYTVKNNVCPPVTANTEVFVYEFPPIVIQSDVTNGCEPLTVSFIEASSNIGFTYEWDFGDNSGMTSALRNPVHTFEESGMYSVGVYVTSPEKCTQFESIDNMITVYPTPQARFNYTPNSGKLVESPKIYFTNTSTGSYLDIWAFGDGDSSSVEHPTHLYREAGKYTVTLITESEYGCLDTTQQDVLIENQFSFYTPDAINPYIGNINSVFRPFGHGIDKENGYSMAIYDRWGELIFYTTDWETGWDARVKDKTIAEVGTYTWIITFMDITGNKYQKTGDVTVIR